MEADTDTHSDGDDCIQCPWCGEMHTDLHELDLSDGGEAVRTCSCGHEFTVYCTITVDYLATREGKDSPKGTL